MEDRSLYTYGFLNTPVASLELPIGIAKQVLLVSHAGVSALVEPEVEIAAIKKEDERLIEAVLSHDRVIYQVFCQTTVLPLRFGTSFASEETLLTHLELNAQDYLNKLNQLKGKSEYLLKFIPRQLDEANIPTETGGRQYFLAKKQRYQTQQEFSIIQKKEWENIVETIEQNVSKSAFFIQDREGEARIYLLISGGEESLIAEYFLAWEAACPRWELQLGEALPPYHFI